MTKKPLFINPGNKLKEKVGDGGLPPAILQKCEQFLESIPVDFTPYGFRFLEELKTMRQRVGTNGADEAALLQIIANPIMQLKSNSGMFQYQLISMISDVMLRFMEHVRVPDAEFIVIFDVYLNLLENILNKQLRGDCGREGYRLTQDLHKACLHYYESHGIRP
ncbi:MAG: hypothetical protein WC989_00690 [Micavibrio sp.]